MRAVVVSGPDQADLESVKDPTPGPQDLIVAVDSCGVCGTDVHIFGGDYPAARYPLVPGHEIAGTVVATGSEVSRDLDGRFVVVDPVVACGHCSDCRAGQTNLCRNWEGYGVTLPGGFAEYVRVRAVDAEIVPATVPPHWATLAEPLSCVLHALDRLGPVRPGQSVLVIGAGPTGLMLTRMLTAAGALVDVVERSDERRHRAPNFGARGVGASTKDLEQSQGWDVVIEATGSVAGFESGLAAVRRAGRFHVFGVAGPDARAAVSPYDIFARELTITGSQSLQGTLHRAVLLLSEGLLDGDWFITDRINVNDFAQALDKVRDGEGVKLQLIPGNQHA
jgi:2-desacetyl-2-hydroxyethyl bacteriochlorophyllide A dehydrogenase